METMYCFTTRTSSGGSQWSFEQSFSSDTEAVNWASQNTINLSGWRSFLGIDVWRNDKETATAKDHVAFVSLGEQSVKVSGTR